jgi:molybdopterin-guanine dinucleotide biosynthesis protein A
MSASAGSPAVPEPAGLLPGPVEPAPAGPRPALPGLLLLGAAGRNAGKTGLAERVLRRFAPQRELVGLKVTAVGAGADHECPRGGEGCGVCRSFSGPFLLTEEHGGPAGKDTTRMYHAGARRVLWLRVHRAGLAAGLAALREALGPGALVVGESNTLRTAVDPDLFLVLRRRGSTALKSSTREVLGFADRLVEFDGSGFDLDPEALEVTDGRWRLREPATGIVLAGGESRRMGFDKRTLAVDGTRLLQQVVDRLRPLVREVLIGVGPEGLADPPAGTRLVLDRAPGQGPLLALAGCLAASTSDRNLVAACDLPDLPAPLLERLLADAALADAAVPRGPDGRLEPLLAVYRRRLLPDLERLLADGERSVLRLFDQRNVRYVPLAELGLAAVPNLNTPQDLAAFTARRTPPGTAGRSS